MIDSITHFFGNYFNWQFHHIIDSLSNPTSPGSIYLYIIICLRIYGRYFLDKK